MNASFCTGKDTTDAAHASVERGFYSMKRLLKNKNTCEDHNKNAKAQKDIFMRAHTATDEHVYV